MSTGLSGDDTITGTDGSDQLAGGAGSDSLDGGSGSDFISSGSGSDIVDGGAGSDTINAGSGNDTLIYTYDPTAVAKDVYIGGSGVDKLVLNIDSSYWTGEMQTSYDGFMAQINAALAAKKTGEIPSSEKLTFTFTFPNGSTLTISMIESIDLQLSTSNHQPTINGATHPFGLGESTGDSSAQDIAAVSGTITVTDLDVGDNLSFAVTGNASAVYSGGALPPGVDISALVASGAISFGSLTSNGGQQTANWTYDPAAADLDWLRAGDTLTLTYAAQVNDGQGVVGAQPLVITITGENDPAQIAGVLSGDVWEDGASLVPAQLTTAIGALTVSDVDGADVLVNTGITAGTYGTFSLMNNGGSWSWSYTLDSAHTAVDALDHGQTLHDYLTVTADDGTTSQVDVTIHGVADFTVTTAASTAEHLIGSGNFLASNKVGMVTPNDAGAVSYALAGDTSGGAFAIQADGSIVVRDFSLMDYEGTGLDADNAYTLTILATQDGVTRQLAAKIVISDVASVIGSSSADIADGGAAAETFNLQNGVDVGFGDDGGDTVSGGNAGDLLFGGAGDDSLAGENSNDLLYGGAGVDTMAGSSGTDTFVFGAGALDGTVDRVTDFVATGEKVFLLNDHSSVFDTLASGTLASTAFDTITSSVGSDINALIAAASDGLTRIIYDTTTGALYYDEDGTGGVGAIKFVDLDGTLAGFSASNIEAGTLSTVTNPLIGVS